MRKALAAMVWLLVVFTLPMSVGLDAACQLAHANMALAMGADRDPRAHHHHAGHDADHDTGAPQPVPHDHGRADTSCCHIMGAGPVGLPSQTTAVLFPSRMAGTVYWLADHPIRGRSPPPALGPPRA